MSILLPGPAELRAIVVGVERYQKLGPEFDTAGAASGAIAFAAWLIKQRSVAEANVELWLLPCPDTDVADLCEKAGIGAIAIRPFEWSVFREAMAEPQGVFASGSFLMVYYCGHGVVHGPTSQQYLVLPEASQGQFRCFATGNWRELFKTAGWYRFEHQLWMVDACRNQWGDAMKPISDEWTVSNPSAAYQCAMFSCASGETAVVDAETGPRFTGELLRTLAKAPPEAWPPFHLALAETAAQMRSDPLAQQNPALCIGEDWFGVPLGGTVPAEVSLSVMLSRVALHFDRLKSHVMRAQAIAPVGFAPPTSLQQALELLHGLPPVGGIPPMLDFAARVAGDVGSNDLQAWVDARLTEQQRAELRHRLAQNVICVRLMLWYRDDAGQACIEGDLEIVHGGGNVLPWQRMPAKPVSHDTVLQTLGQWIQAVYDHVGGRALDLMVELFLPKKMLITAAYDTATVPIAEGDDWQFGHDAPALLRCTDRYKGTARVSRWLTNAPAILARLAGLTADPVRWAAAPEKAEQWKRALLAADANAPVWLGFDPNATTGDEPFDTALAQGLPALLWLRTPVGAAGIEPLCAQLQALLKCSLDELPRTISALRRDPAHDAIRTVALMLDDPARVPAMWTPWKQPGGNAV